QSIFLPSTAGNERCCACRVESSIALRIAEEGRQGDDRHAFFEAGNQEDGAGRRVVECNAERIAAKHLIADVLPCAVNEPSRFAPANRATSIVERWVLPAGDRVAKYRLEDGGHEQCPL